jgi:FMN phosphatase YigB (HAD superfamily)
MTLKAVFFDIGSTLVTGPGSGVASRLAARLGLDGATKAALNTTLMTTDFRTPEAVTQHVLGLNLAAPAATIRAAVFDIWNSQLGEARAIEGALESLQAWAQTGATLCLISNIWLPYQLAAMEALGPRLDAWIAPENRIYSFEIGAAKPAALPFARALAMARCAPHEAIMVGDSYREDIAPAIALGLNTAWLLRRADREAEHIQAVINGAAARPTMALAGVHEFLPGGVAHGLAQAA